MKKKQTESVANKNNSRMRDQTSVNSKHDYRGINKYRSVRHTECLNCEKNNQDTFRKSKHKFESR